MKLNTAFLVFGCIASMNAFATLTVCEGTDKNGNEFSVRFDSARDESEVRYKDLSKVNRRYEEGSIGAPISAALNQPKKKHSIIVTSDVVQNEEDDIRATNEDNPVVFILHQKIITDNISGHYFYEGYTKRPADLNHPGKDINIEQNQFRLTLSSDNSSGSLLVYPAEGPSLGQRYSLPKCRVIDARSAIAQPKSGPYPLDPEAEVSNRVEKPVSQSPGKWSTYEEYHSPGSDAGNLW